MAFPAVYGNVVDSFIIELVVIVVIGTPVVEDHFDFITDEMASNRYASVASLFEMSCLLVSIVIFHTELAEMATVTTASSWIFVVYLLFLSLRKWCRRQTRGSRLRWESIVRRCGSQKGWPV